MVGLEVRDRSLDHFAIRLGIERCWGRKERSNEP
jgi:hypothetical protein